MTQNKCSRTGCGHQALKLVVWRNPKIHTDGRTKTWGACEEHESFLVDYLSQRGFFLRLESIEAKHD